MNKRMIDRVSYIYLSLSGEIVRLQRVRERYGKMYDRLTHRETVDDLRSPYTVDP